ncbi:MAG: hypothetical protein J6C27_02510 [Clostridia bacterium]|nr:hypothetical protein [Clostridia bacterium]
MNALQVKRSLINSGVDKLYHVNTVVTSLSFINQGGLLSRQTAEIMGVPQTPQSSDDIDREFGIYNDIFFDSVDIHDRAKRPNDYGPVMFVYSVDVLDTLTEYDICITRDNPIYWEDGMQDNEKYFSSEQEILFGFSKGDFNKHITVRNISVPLPFNYLEEIVIDDPGMEHIELLNKAKESIESSLNIIGIRVPVNVRKCSLNCSCLSKYTTSNPGYAYHRFKTQL